MSNKSSADDDEDGDVADEDDVSQTVVERKLFQETGKRRRDFSRQEFVQEVWKWKNECVLTSAFRTFVPFVLV